MIKGMTAGIGEVVGLGKEEVVHSKNDIVKIT